MEITENKLKGEFKPQEKFIEFIGGKSNVNFISKEATIDGKYLSGMGMDGIKFKLTIFDDGSVNFDEVETKTTTKEIRSRLLDTICEKRVSPSIFNKMIFVDLQFMSIQKINEKEVPLFLSVDYQTPIQKLASLFEDDSTTIEISEESNSKIDDLLSIFDDEEIEVIEEVQVITMDQDIPSYDDYLKKQFENAKIEKIEELNRDLLSKKKELSKLNSQLMSTEKRITEFEGSISLLEERLKSLEPDKEFNGYYFSVSERKNEEIVFEPEVELTLRNKLKKVKRINVENFMNLFKMGEFHIFLGKETENGVTEVDYEQLDNEIIELLSKEKIYLIDKKIIYEGEMIWADIVNKMIKMGFKEDHSLSKYFEVETDMEHIEFEEIENKTITNFPFTETISKSSSWVEIVKNKIKNFFN